MDDFYSISVNSDPKHGLGLLASDLEETFQFPSSCGDPDVLGSGDKTISRSSTAVTPQSECSVRTTLSATTNISPTSDIFSFRDKPTPQDIENMYTDPTQSIVPGRQSRAASVTWPTPTSMSMGISNTVTPPLRPVSHRPQSFSYRTQQDHTPPPPSAFFTNPSPNLQPQTISMHSPFLSPNMQSPLVPQISQLPAQNGFMQAQMSGNPSSYYAPVGHSQSLPAQQLQHQFQHQLQFQQQNLAAHRRTLPTQSQTNVPGVFSHQIPSQTDSPSQSQSYNHANNSISTSSIGSSTGNTPSLPNTTGNSSTGYQCFSHGCGGRHFSNWGNLVRHHRERQLRSKAGAKPTCPRCGKGFTRSSARDAHVAGLKCVLGRRRRGVGGTAAGAAATTVAATTSAGSATDGTPASPGSDATGNLDTTIKGEATSGVVADLDIDVELGDRRRGQFGQHHATHQHRNGRERESMGDGSEHDHDGSNDNGSDDGGEDDYNDNDNEDDAEEEDEMPGTRRHNHHHHHHHHHQQNNALETFHDGDTSSHHDHHHRDQHQHHLLANSLNFDIGVGSGGMLSGPAYLTPQHLQFEH